MRRSSLVIVAVLLLVVGTAAIGVAGCSDFYKSADTTSTAQGTANAGALSGSPESIIEAMMNASGDIKSATASFQMDLEMDLDPSQLSPEDAMGLGMFQGPVTASGTLAMSYESQMADLDLTLAAAGFSYNMGVRMVDENMWLRMLGQWYDLTPALEEAGRDELGLWERPYDLEALESIMAAEGADWRDWLGDTSLVGEETLADTDVYHLVSTPDLAKLLSDAVALMQSEELMDLLDPSGSLAQSVGQDFPTPAEWQEVQAMIPQMFTGVTLDMWAGKNDNLLRRMTGHANFVPPAEAEMDGLKSVEVTMSLSYDSINEPVTVEAPESFLPFSAFEEMFGGGAGRLLPFVGEAGDGGPLSL